MSGLQGLAQEMIWFDKFRYDEAERCFYEGMNGIPQTPQSQNASKSEDQSELVSRLKSLELDNKNLHNVVDDLRSMLLKLESRMAVLEKSQAPAPKTAPVTKAAPLQKPKVEEQNGVDDDDDDDIDLFGSDEEDEEAERIKAERVKEYSARKAKKPVLIAKSSILLDVKPWDDETDMAKLEECVRSIQLDGLLWGASKLVPVGYGIKKLQINCVVEDDKVGTDILEEEITQFEDYVQSVDIAAFNKI
ncbi:elongation factor 1-delta-like isoform X4 [Myxocyprinus asiaticus]|uniref:elongation factor 1-delta-like isoform X4 n=1 Tax=Myxocyprinus asiaticus TaxID=70543 RepID=UPI0022226FBA|nr:elongation factor 1-delta-like isoform X4 [Myxocyprinus asiaticus]